MIAKEAKLKALVQLIPRANLDSVRSNVIGDNVAFVTPFGTRPNVYADFTASGRSLQCIEDTIQRHVLPFYANTHTTTSVTGLTSTTLREDARRTIAASVNAHPDKDSVIFTGSGATAAIQTLAKAIASLKYDFSSHLNPTPRLHTAEFAVLNERGPSRLHPGASQICGGAWLAILPQYKFDQSTGEWGHKNSDTTPKTIY
ncbi:Aste57867_25284 [Aphanomyces stellatus]|uniref:Aste57867_25284 protein n=1 Tax=Aphanomyces stellatus TaxID=120398 RepID=A0A485LSN8_9STRA|nr:hypothetical protein As57867_025206 [Aphanomyces stellatus]VFU01910.1 Aste57867_25284 [Aphanomyces stellatus]